MGTVTYENVTLLENGIYEAVPIINGVVYNKKTFFPSFWTEETVVEKILDVFKKCYENKNYKIDWTGSYIMTDLTSCGVEIKLIYDPKERLIATAYPIVKKGL